MQSLPRISRVGWLRFVLYSNIWIALTASSLCWLFYQVFALPENPWVLAFVFSGTLFTYNFQRMVKLKTGQNLTGERKNWMHRNMGFSWGVTIISALVSLVCLLLLNIEVVWILVPAGVIAFLYVGRLISVKQLGLRDIPHLKVYLVAFVWSILSGVLPALNDGVSFSSPVWIFTAAVFLVILALSIVFDLRDVDLDEKSTRTIPQLVGERGARVLAAFILLAGCFLWSLIGADLVFPAAVTGISGVILLGVYQPSRSDFYYSFLMDGVILLPALTYFIQTVWLSFWR